MIRNKTIITVAVTGSIGDKSQHPALPITPGEIANSALEAWRAGASVAHVHVRDPSTGKPSLAFELYREVVERIRDGSNMLINLTAGAGARIVPDSADPVGLDSASTWRSPAKRVEHIMKLQPELCSLDIGSMNFGEHVFANPLPHLRIMAELIKTSGARPELEVFDLGHVAIARALISEGLIRTPPLFQLCLGVRWGMPASAKNMLLMKDALPAEAPWGAFGIGSSCFPMVALAALLGGNVRVGFEDNFYLRAGVPAESNAQLVEKTVTILRALDREPASPQEAKEILCIP